MLMTLLFTLKIKFVVEIIIIRKSCVANLLREFLIMKHVCETNKEDLTVFHSVACKQTPPRHSHGRRVKRKETLQSRLRNWNSAYSAPSPHWQGCQFWPVSTEQKWASNVHKAHDRSILHDWTKPWKYGCSEKMKHQKIVEFLFS